MDSTRREALKLALLGALAAAMPARLARAEAPATKIRLADGTWLESTPDGVFHDTPRGRTKVQQGSFVGADGKPVVVQAGRLARGRAESFVQDNGPSWVKAMGQPNLEPRGQAGAFMESNGPSWVKASGEPGAVVTEPKAQSVLRAVPKKGLQSPSP